MISRLLVRSLDGVEYIHNPATPLQTFAATKPSFVHRRLVPLNFRFLTLVRGREYLYPVMGEANPEPEAGEQGVAPQKEFPIIAKLAAGYCGQVA
jgi:hypothetical protein